MLAYNLYKFKEQAVFLNQETRQFDHKLNSGDFGLCFGNMNRWQVNLLVGVGTASFVSMYYFKNGERDMNKYSALNGVYSSSCFSYRTELTVKLLKHLINFPPRLIPK